MTLSTSTENCPDLLTSGIDLPCATCDTGRSLAALGFCCRDFRSTLGCFATGVTVVTALAPDGEPIGLTINSFNSVSLDPPLILWSLSLGSPMLESFRNASHYSVNVLSADQQNLSDRFASRSNEHFADLPQRSSGPAIIRSMFFRLTSRISRTVLRSAASITSSTCRNARGWAARR